MGVAKLDMYTRRQALCALAGAAVSLGLGGCAVMGNGSSWKGASSAEAAREAMEWWQKTVVYEVYPKSFLDTEGAGTGTIAGITAKLDYLVSLGVGAIWLTPIFRSPMRDNGYDVADYYDIDPSFGTMDDMDELIARAGEHGIRIVMDLVMNHTSDENPWFLESASSRDNDKADWYIWRDAAPGGGAPTNWRSIFGGSAWTWCESREQYYLHTFADFQPDLNWECEAMREELFRMARFWLDKGVGGFRIDAVTYIKKPAFEDGEADGSDGLAAVHVMTANTEGILDFLNEFKREVMEGTDAFAVGEANGVPVEELSLWVGEQGVFDMIFEFSHILVPLGGREIWCEPAEWKLTELKAALTASQRNTANDGWYPIYFENHDQPRSVDHLLFDAADKVAGAKMLATVLMTLRGTPFVYQGQELGYENVAWDSIDDYDDVSSKNQYQVALERGHTEEEALACVHDHSRDNARTPMQWDASENAGFTSGEPWLPVHEDYKTCNVSAQSDDEGSVLSWYRRLAELRCEWPVLVSGDYAELLEGSEEVYAFARDFKGERAVILANFTEHEVAFDERLVEGLDCVLSTHGDTAPGSLRPLEAVVYVTA